MHGAIRVGMGTAQPNLLRVWAMRVVSTTPTIPAGAQFLPRPTGVGTTRSATGRIVTVRIS
jgi:hypothetical protein